MGKLKVYLVIYYGRYDDEVEVGGIYSTEEAALASRERCPANWVPSVEEWEVDGE